jgi:hypothetical protein
MNVCVISGELESNAIVRGKEKKVLVFIVATKAANGDAEVSVSHVPCVVFNPSEDLQQLLTTQGKGKRVEFQGRVQSSRFDAGSEPRSNAEVVVYTKTLRIS